MGKNAIHCLPKPKLTSSNVLYVWPKLQKPNISMLDIKHRKAANHLIWGGETWECLGFLHNFSRKITEKMNRLSKWFQYWSSIYSELYFLWFTRIFYPLQPQTDQNTRNCSVVLLTILLADIENHHIPIIIIEEQFYYLSQWNKRETTLSFKLLNIFSSCRM